VNRAKSAMVIPLALLTACGGGAGKSGSLPPATNTPQTKKSGEATFSFKLPGKTTMTKLRRRYYQSQATQGVAIDWTSTDPTHPDYSAPISATCPVPTLGNSNLPPGVTSCTIDANGDTDYAFQLQIPAGTYPNFTVTTFDTAPTVGDFSGNMLAHGQIAAPVVINPGVANTIPNLTFYGIPASVSFQPGPAQSHVVTYGGNLAVIGNQAQTFYTQAQDADGFDISSNDSGTPTITVAESANDSPQHFTVATTSNPYSFTLTAKDATANATIIVTATPGGTGLTSVTRDVTVTPVQELWTTVEAGNAPYGIWGYPVYGTGSAVQPIDGYNDPIGNALCGGGGSSCNFDYAAIDPSSNTIYAAGINSSSIPAIYAFPLSAAPPGLTVPSGAVYTGAAGDNFTSIAIDAHQHGFIVDNNSGSIQLEAYSTSSGSWTPIVPYGGMGTADAVAVAPTATQVPAALAGSIWVGLSAGGFAVFPQFSGSSFGSPGTATGSGAATPVQVAGFDSNGYLWSTDGSNVYIDSISGTPAAPVVTQLGSLPLSGSAGGTSFAAGSGDTMFFGEGGGEETGFNEYVATCGASSCTISVNAQQVPTASPSFAAIEIQP
jgi:hypothetical protein